MVIHLTARYINFQLYFTGGFSDNQLNKSKILMDASINIRDFFFIFKGNIKVIPMLFRKSLSYFLYYNYTEYSVFYSLFCILF